MRQHAGLHPAKYAAALVRLVQDAGGLVCEKTQMLNYQAKTSGFQICTDRGVFHARDLIVATNGYTGAATQKLRRRFVPVTSYMIATEVLGLGLVGKLFPSGRLITDTNRLLCYYRPCPKGERILFGGRPFYTEVSPQRSAARLRDYLVALFPVLKGVSVSHCWFGNIGYTFDHLPHIGKIDGVHYAGGYCGSGVVMSAWLGGNWQRVFLGKGKG